MNNRSRVYQTHLAFLEAMDLPVLVRTTQKDAAKPFASPGWTSPLSLLSTTAAVGRIALKVTILQNF